MRNITLSGAALVILTSWATTVGAATITVYTDRTEWENALAWQFLTEDFADDELDPEVSFVSTESGHINPTLECYQDVLTSESQNEPMTTWSFVSEIHGYGGNWTLGGPGGSGNGLQVYIPDLSMYVGTISNNYNGEFWGFTSDTPFSSVRLIGGTGTNQQHYCLDDMVYSHCISDLNGDGEVGLSDLSTLLENYGAPSGMSYADGDLDGDGDVDLSDLGILLAVYGTACD